MNRHEAIHKFFNPQPTDMNTKGTAVIVGAGNGGWDVTTYPWQGDFYRPSKDTPGVIVDKPRHVGDVGDYVFVELQRPDLSTPTRVVGFRTDAIISK